MAFEKLVQQGIGYRAWPQGFDPGRTTILMVHGAGGCAQIWNGQLRPLGRQFNAIAIDLPGHGNTSPQKCTEISEYADWLAELMASYFGSPVVLMGHSMGGAICQEVALKDPDHIKALVLVATGPRLKVAPAFLEGLKKDFDSTIDLIIKYAYSLSAPPLMLREGASLMKQAGQEVLYNDFAACNRFDAQDRIGKIHIPTLVICGTDDKLTPPSLAHKLQEGIKESKMVEIPSAGHMVMIEAWRAFNEAVAEFVTTLP